MTMPGVDTPDDQGTEAMSGQRLKRPLTLICLVIVLVVGVFGALYGRVLWVFAHPPPVYLRLENLTWMDDGWVYAVNEPLSAGYGTIWRFKPDSEPEQVRFAPPLGNQVGSGTLSSAARSRWPEGCDARALARASDSVLTVAIECLYRRLTSLFAVDTSTGVVRRIGDLGHLTDIAEMAWSPDLQVGYTADDQCSTMQRVQIGSEATESRGVGGPLVRTATQGQCALRDVRHPVVTQSFLYFDAWSLQAPDEHGAAPPGQTRPRPPAIDAWVERRAMPDGEPVTVADGFTAVTDLAVSSDDAHLVVSGERNNSVWSCWVVDLNTGAITDLQVAKSGDISLSPSGEQVAIWTGYRAVFRDL